jgi:hypothetical protein
MTNRPPKIVALVADAFQEGEYFFPKDASRNRATSTRRRTGTGGGHHPVCRM